MSVLSWRVLSSAVRSSPKLPGSFLSFEAILRSVSILVVAMLLGACNTSPQKPDLVFDAGSLSDKQWEQANKECQFEAAKATASIRPGDASGDKFRKIYILCVETKGITFLGTEDKLARRKT
jgi:hypothetical protein